jgi:predicted nucleotidyltransferase
MKFGLSEDNIEKINGIFKNHPEVTEAIIYGSRAKGNHREGSDIDLTLKGSNLTEELRSVIWTAIDELNTPYLIDLSIYENLNSAGLIDHIKRVGQVFYKKADLK